MGERLGVAEERGRDQKCTFLKMVKVIERYRKGERKR